jgi:Na+-transporting NADH:ubiquinone oxidoreductase subunit NqrB
MSTPWFGGVCDTLLQRIQAWEHKYELGTIYATRKFLTENFEQIDAPVQFLHNIPFSLPEMTHLVRILTAERPKWTLTVDFTKILGVMRNPLLMRKFSKIIQARPGGFFVMALVLEKTEICELANILLAVKDGKPIPTMESLQLEKKKAGKRLWES